MAKPKKINVSVMDPTSEPYKILHSVLDKHHDDIRTARVQIALAWRYRLKSDPDGILVLGKCIKITDLHKEFMDYDFIIILNYEAWQSFSLAQKEALIDHELCHASIAVDEETGENKVDERGRTVFRIRKHNIEEFREIIERHGCYKDDLKKFAEAILKEKKESQQLPLQQEPNVAGSRAN